MGILDELRLTAVKLFNRNVSNTPPDTNGNRYSYDMGFAKAVTQTGAAVRSSGDEKLKECVPDPDRREKIGRIISGIGKFAVDSTVNESLKGITGHSLSLSLCVCILRTWIVWPYGHSIDWDLAGLFGDLTMDLGNNDAVSLSLCLYLKLKQDLRVRDRLATAMLLLPFSACCPSNYFDFTVTVAVFKAEAGGLSCFSVECLQSFSREAFSFFNRGEFVYCPTFLSGLSVVHIMHLWFGSKDFKAHLSSVLGTQGKLVVAMVLVVFPSQVEAPFACFVPLMMVELPLLFSFGGIQVYKLVKEGLKDQPLLPNPNENKKPELTAVMEEMQARMEKMQEDMNTIKQQSKISMESAKGSDPWKERFHFAFACIRHLKSNALLEIVRLLTLHFSPFLISLGGTLMYDIVKEGLKEEPPLPNSNESKKSKQTVAVEEMQAKMERMQEEMNTITQQSKILMEKMQQEMNTVKQEMNTIKQEMNTIRSRL
ncbi:hypothetical protein RHSIM_Rhsim04G0018000 [Rhododendron simsii]|uniref:Uncharacterized protein n=1 Tax=Rhododendron simsii TaxID=118357 RepID=A0A834H1H7_RHOSS|nr:hypothetical protein RHSIM_Rhsim04G0018000 [Rhododendron simsii]